MTWTALFAYLAALGWLAVGALYLELRAQKQHTAKLVHVLGLINGAWTETCNLVRWAEAHRRVSGIDPDADIVIADAASAERVH